MIRLLILSLFGFLSVILQGALMHFGWSDNFLPQLVLIVVIYMGFNELSVLATFVVFLLGLLLDLSSALLLGPWAGALVTVYGSLAILSSRFFIDSPLVAAFISFFAAVFANFMYVFLGYEYARISWEDLTRVCGQALATALVAPVFLGLIARKLKRRTPHSLGRSLATSANT